mgnify:FL=1
MTVHVVAVHLHPMAMTGENTVLTPAISMRDLKAVTELNPEEFDSELRYRATLLAAEEMLKKGLILAEEYDRIDTALLKKYRPFVGMLLAGKSDVQEEKT